MAVFLVYMAVMLSLLVVGWLLCMLALYLVYKSIGGRKPFFRYMKDLGF